VLDLLIVDETNPRSLGYQLAAVATHIDTLPQADTTGTRTEVQRMALAMLNDVRLADVVTLALVNPAGGNQSGRRVALAALLTSECERVSQLSDALTRRYFSVVEKEPRWTRTSARIAP
jgi:uncharacterized alpha-E superfamily protein